LKIYPYDIHDGGYAEAVKKIGVSECGAAIMKERFALSTFFVADISTPAANVVKQQLLSLGGEAAVPAHAIDCSKPKSSFFFSLRRDLCGALVERLRLQYWKLPQVAEFIEKFNMLRAPWFSFSFDGIDTSRPNLMGIINVTPDSFSDGGSYASVDDVLKRVSEMIGEGVDIVDVGGESTRPGAAFVDAETEIGRTVPVIKAISGSFPKLTISIDTRKSEVAYEAAKAGAKIINDVSGLRYDPKMADLCCDLDLPVIIGHTPGDAEDLHGKGEYRDVTMEVTDFLNESKEMLLSKGYDEKKIIVDPGFGFGKDTGHNLELLNHFEMLFACTSPVAVGVSRKRFIGAVTGRENISERVAGTLAVNMIALEKGAALIRVHDVAGAADCLKIFNALKELKC